MALADNIRYLRRKRGWSQDYLAERLGYKSYTTIQKWESGVSEPSLKKAHAIADLFGVDINDLAGPSIEEEETSLIASDRLAKVLSPEDIELLKKFHALDERGKSVVESVLNAEYEHQQPALHVVAAANGQRAFFEERDDLPPLLPEDPPDV